MSENQNVKDLRWNSVSGISASIADFKYDDIACITKFVLRFVENEDEILLVADEVTATLEDDFVCMRKRDAIKDVCAWNKTTGSWRGYSMLHDFKLHGTSDKQKIESREFWNICHNAYPAINDFLLRYVYLNNRNLFKAASSELIFRATCLIDYLDDLNVIEALCSHVNVVDIFDQMRKGDLVVKDGRKLKSAVGLPTDIITRLHEWNLDRHLSKFQTLVCSGVIVPDEIRDLFDFLTALQKLAKKRKLGYGSWTPMREIDHILETVQFGCCLSDLTKCLAREMLMFSAFDPWHLERISRVYRDIYNMLEPTKPIRPQQNADKWHYIVSRNQQIMKNSRAKEYEAAANEINKRSMIVGEYLIKCPDTENELYAIGEAYNNCLPTYRDRIIDEGAVIYSMYRLDANGNVTETIPSVTFEITSNMDFLQIKTFNDQDVDDPTVIGVLKEWKTKMSRKQSA